MPDVWGLDLTELPDTDSLFEADGPILQAEEQAARLFHAQRTLFSAGGCTLCLQAMLRLALPQGGKILAGARDSPQYSQRHGPTRYCARFGFTRSRTPESAYRDASVPHKVEKALTEQPDIKAVYLTSPDYFGVCSDIGAICRVAHAHGVPVLVDNAHGTHLGLLQGVMDGVDHPLALGADLTACSAHKTLPVLTGGAFLNIGDTPLAKRDRYSERAKEAMALFGSTSPNYMTMASLEQAADWVQREGKSAFQKLVKRMEPLWDQCNQKHLPLPLGPKG